MNPLRTRMPRQIARLNRSKESARRLLLRSPDIYRCLRVVVSLVEPVVFDRRHSFEAESRGLA